MQVANDIEQRVIKIIGLLTGIPTEEITTSSTFQELDLDSLARIEMLVELEREFGVESDDPNEEDEDALQKVQNVADAIELTKSMLAGQEA